MTSLEFRTFIRTWFDNVYPLQTLIRMDENGTRPELPYVTYAVTSKTKIGQAQIFTTNIDGELSIKSHKDVIVSFQGYGNNSEDIIEGLQYSLNNETVKQLFIDNCVAIRNDNSEIQELPVGIDDSQERRYLYEPSFGYAYSEVEDVGYIETVEVIPTINQPT